MKLTTIILALALGAADAEPMTATEARAFVQRVAIAAKECSAALEITKDLSQCDRFYTLTSTPGDTRMTQAFAALMQYADEAESNGDTSAMQNLTETFQRLEDINSTRYLLKLFMDEGKYVPPEPR